MPRKKEQIKRDAPRRAVVPWPDTPREQALCVIRRIIGGATLQELERDNPAFDLIEFWDTLESDPEVAAYYEKAMIRAAHYFGHEARDLFKRLMEDPDASPEDIRKAALLAEQNRWLAGAMNPHVYRHQPVTPLQTQVIINTTLDLGQANPPITIEAENPYRLTLPAPSEAELSVLADEVAALEAARRESR